ncbi:MAG: hypothetical protein OEW19_22800 [Acidobacteriota bacterium]|nr:hypothetical protein [Acidobacteriota bacterium]
MNRLRVPLLAVLVAACTADSVQAQWTIYDPSNVARNTFTALTKAQTLVVQNEQYSKLRRMAQRLSLFTSLAKYVLDDVPAWRIHDFADPNSVLFARDYHAALNYGDRPGAGFQSVARARLAAAAALGRMAPAARDATLRALATLDAADSSIIAATHQTGALRFNGRRELAAVAALERHVVDESNEQSATAVLDKISGAEMIGARQKQARAQFVAALLEQLLIDNKRARDTEAVAMNMLLGRLRDGRVQDARLLAGAGDDLRTWRQP